MPSAYSYSKTIVNSYLNKTKTIKANTIEELNLKVKEQTALWHKQEIAQRVKEEEKRHINELKSKTESLNSSAQHQMHEYDSIFSSALTKEYNIDWEKEKKKFIYPNFSYKKFKFTKQPPQKHDVGYFYALCKVPKRTFLESIFTNLKTRRELKEKDAVAQYESWQNEYNENSAKYTLEKNEAKAQHDKSQAEALSKYNTEKALAEQSVIQFNQEIDEMHKGYETGNPKAVAQTIKKYLKKTQWCFKKNIEYSVDHSANDGVVVISATLPDVNSISKIKEYKYVNASQSIKEIEFKKKEFDTLYDSIIKQTSLRILYETMSYDYKHNINLAVFNGWVNKIDPATGNDFRACIISVQMNRNDFENINFSNIDVDACIKKLKGLYAGNLTELVPVKPIMELNTDDSRFITSKDIIDTLETGENLATMDWEDFEQLVRELFSKYFSGEGQNVQVTQSSRDGGVDAIAFDQDPIRGGKFVIQAKRYNRVVPVSAVRDLYGTMINEGAAKGILVTTSYFGNDSREFVKDKPITLIDGNNLLHMFAEYGYDVHIQLQNSNIHNSQLN